MTTFTFHEGYTSQELFDHVFVELCMVEEYGPPSLQLMLMDYKRRIQEEWRQSHSLAPLLVPTKRMPSFVAKVRHSLINAAQSFLSGVKRTVGPTASESRYAHSSTSEDDFGFEIPENLRSAEDDVSDPDDSRPPDTEGPPRARSKTKPRTLVSTGKCPVCGQEKRHLRAHLMTKKNDHGWSASKYKQWLTQSQPPKK